MEKFRYRKSDKKALLIQPLKPDLERGSSQLGMMIALTIGGAIVVGLVYGISIEEDEPVRQPIPFPHSRHAGPVSAGGHDINCLYCHTYARRSPVAGIPPLAKCMGCHRTIATDKTAIKTLTAYWKSGRPIPWKKVHDLPDFVYFSHERHIQRFVFREGQAVKQVCGYCHGDVQQMSVAQRKKPLTMGWCLSCHEQFQDDSKSAPEPASEWRIGIPGTSLNAAGAKSGPHPLAANKAPSDCWDCHK